MTSRAERLSLAAAAAAPLRTHAADAARRRVGLLDHGGNVVGYTTLLEVQKQLTARHALEIEVQPDEKPREVVCVRCGLPAPVPTVGRPPQFCVRCKSARCHDCGGPLSAGASSPARNAALAGKPRYCVECLLRRQRENRVPCSACGELLNAKASSKARCAGTTQTVKCRPCYRGLR